ncbi:MAG: hypothetical protein IRY91_09445, partial [Gemmatimonadaceae bacterium]|nr:hypothetical protein [Gemmatimonadaceae bacterium]
PSPPTVAAAPAAAEPALDSVDGLHEMFADRIPSPADEDAASTLAGAFSEEYTAPAAPITGEPARAASDPLSLDNVFRDGRPRTPPRATAQNVSFDEFFSRRESGEIDPGAETGGADGAADGSAHPAAGDSDGEKDLELFHAWLEGLKK